MQPHWVNTVDTKPNKDREVQVLVVQDSTCSLTGGSVYDIDYGLAVLSGGHWAFVGTRPQYTRIVAWLESDRRLDRCELEKVPKDSIRF